MSAMRSLWSDGDNGSLQWCTWNVMWI